MHYYHYTSFIEFVEQDERVLLKNGCYTYRKNLHLGGGGGGVRKKQPLHGIGLSTCVVIKSN